MKQKLQNDEYLEELKLPYDSVNYHGKKILNSDYFLSIIAQPGANKFTIQTTCLVIECSDKKSSEELYKNVQKIPRQFLPCHLIYLTKTGKNIG